MSEWFAPDALLGSPIPPPRWLDRRSRSRHYRGAHVMSDLGPMYGHGSSRSVPGRWIDFELEEVRGHVNRPVVKGWAFGLAIVGLIVMYAAFLWLSGASRSDPWPGVITFIAIPIGWFAALFLVGHFEVELELRPHALAVRSWIDLFFDRPGADLGPPAHVTATWLDPGHIRLASPTADIVVSMRLWPSWMRTGIADHLDHWGIELHDPAHPHSHGSRKHRREREARAARE